MSSGYENVVGGRVKLKGKALDVKAAAGIKKKKKKVMMIENQIEDLGQSVKLSNENVSAGEKTPIWYEHLTPAERRYMEQRAKLDMDRLAKIFQKLGQLMLDASPPPSGRRF